MKSVIGYSIILLIFLAGCNESEDTMKSKNTTTENAGSDTSAYYDNKAYEIATFGGGCFWGVEMAFRKLEGVVATSVGYEGGHLQNPSYKDVCSDKTGHAEVVEIVYNPQIIHYKDLLDHFWAIHNPTTVNRQGWDIGSQYRSVVFYHNEKQKALAEAAKENLEQSEKFSKPIVTQIVPAGPFYRAEEYHQQYLEKRGKTSCHI